MSMEKNFSQRDINIDIIRVIAMLMVVYMHTVYNFSLRIDFFATKLWFLIEPLTIISKTCVLLFFMVSGYLVIGKKRSIAENWQKTKQRILIPLIFFEIVNIAYAAYLYHFEQGVGIFWQGQLTRLIGHPNSPLWFLVVLLYLYALNPIWDIVFEEKNKAVAQAITKWAFALSVIIMFFAFLSGKVDSIFNLFTSWVGYACFYLYGGLVVRGWSTHTKKTNVLCILIGFALTMLGDYATGWSQLNAQDFIFQDYTGNFLSLPIMVLSIGVFNYLVSKHWRLKAWVVKSITLLASLSYGIYLLHTYVVSFLTDIISFNFDQIAMNVYSYILCSFSVVLGASIVLSIILKKIPILRQVIGEEA